MFPPSAGFFWEHLWAPRPATASLPWHLMGCFGFSTFHMSMTDKCLLSRPIWAQVYMAIAFPLGWFTNPTYLKLNSNFLLRMHASNISYQWIYLHPFLCSLFLYAKQWLAILRYQFEHYFFDPSLSHSILLSRPSTVYSSKYPGFPTHQITPYFLFTYFHRPLDLELHNRKHICFMSTCISKTPAWYCSMLNKWLIIVCCKSVSAAELIKSVNDISLEN